jgi:hypothetical protein
LIHREGICIDLLIAAHSPQAHLIGPSDLRRKAFYAPSEFRTNAQINGDQIAPDVIGLSNGGFVSGYNNSAFHGIALDFYDAADNGIGLRFPYGTFTDLSAGQPALTQLSNGNVLVVWDENLASDSGIKGRLFSPTGTTIGDVLPLVISVSDLKDPQVAALVGGGFVVTLTAVGGGGDEDVDYARYDDAGTAQQLFINTVTGNQNDSAVAALADGGFVITYTDATDPRHQDIRAVIYDANGSVRKADFLVSSDKLLMNDQFQSKVVGLPNGNFAVVYTDSHWADENGTDGITLKIYNPAGGNVTPGAFIHVNTPTPGFNESDPDVTVLPNGFIVVTWTYPSSPTDHDIYVRMLNIVAGAASTTILSQGAVIVCVFLSRRRP